MPVTGRPAHATTDQDGQFTLSTLKPQDGAVVGKHRVAILSGDAAGVIPMPGTPEARKWKPTRSKLPAKYASAQTSGLEFEVKPGAPNNFVLTLD